MSHHTSCLFIISMADTHGDEWSTRGCMYVFPGGVVDSVRRQQSILRYMFPFSTVIQTSCPPLKLLQLLHQPVSRWGGGTHCPVLDQAPEADRGQHQTSWVSWLEPFPSALRWPFWDCVFRCVWSEPDTSFSRNFGGRKNGWRWRDWKKQKMKNHFCPSAIIQI